MWIDYAIYLSCKYLALGKRPSVTSVNSLVLSIVLSINSTISKFVLVATHLDFLEGFFFRCIKLVRGEIIVKIFPLTYSVNLGITNLRDLKYWENRIKIEENWWNNQLKFNQICLTSYAQYRNYLNFYIFLLNSIFLIQLYDNFFYICNYTHNLLFYSTIDMHSSFLLKMSAYAHTRLFMTTTFMKARKDKINLKWFKPQWFINSDVL